MKFSKLYNCNIPNDWNDMTAEQQIQYLADATGKCYRCEICTWSRRAFCGE